MTDTVDLLESAYGGLLAVVDTLDEEAGWRPTGCAGWVVRDLLFHLLSDAQRALVAFGTPAAGPADVDAVSYWEAWQPGGPAAEANRRNIRIIASVFSRVRPLADLYAETARAVLVQARRQDGSDLVGTQGHTLTVDSLLTTLAVEAAVHHLDLTAHVTAPGPSADALGAVRRTLDGLLGHPAGAAWEDARYALVGTGRAALSDAERAELGPDAARLPLFG